MAISFAPQRLEEFRRAVYAAGRRLGQEAMYVRFEEPRIELIAVGATGRDEAARRTTASFLAPAHGDPD